jgi:hypothetical protein
MLWRARLIHPLPTAPLVLEGTRRRGQGVNKSGANRETSNCPLNRGRSRQQCAVVWVSFNALWSGPTVSAFGAN